MARYIAQVLTITSTLLLAGGLTSTSLYAQEKDQSLTDRAVQQQQNFSHKDIQQFAKAAKQVGAINNIYFTRIRRAPSREKTVALQTEANKKMVTVIQANGLNVTTYNDIAWASLQDTGLQRKIQKAQSG